jgi:hypothetical protein
MDSELREGEDRSGDLPFVSGRAAVHSLGEVSRAGGLGSLGAS